jgi:hypothetical protein
MPGSVALLGMAVSAMLSYSEAAGSLRLETRAGQAPFDIATKSESFFLAMVTPKAAIRFAAQGYDTHANIYSRFLMREPNPSKSVNILVLHGIGLTHRQKPSSRSEVRLEIHGTYGEEDYTTFNGQFGTSTPGLGQTTARTTIPASLDIVSAGINLEAFQLVTRLSGWGLRLGCDYHNTLTQSQQTSSKADTGYKLPEQTTSILTPSYFQQVSRKSRFAIGVSTTHYHVTNQFDGLVVQPKVDWREDFSETQRGIISAGITFAKTLHTKSEPILDPLLKTQKVSLDPISPIATLTLESKLIQHRNVRLQSQIMTGLAWYFDPILVTGYSNVYFASSLDANIGPRFSMGTRISYATPIEKPTRKDIQDVTILSASLPISYRWSDLWVLETGAQFAMRGPYQAGLSELRGLELWAYLALTGGVQKRKSKPWPQPCTITGGVEVSECQVRE